MELWIGSGLNVVEFATPPIAGVISTGERTFVRKRRRPWRPLAATVNMTVPRQFRAGPCHLDRDRLAYPVGNGRSCSYCGRLDKRRFMDKRIGLICFKSF